MISKLGCKLLLIDQRGIYAIQCDKNEIKNLPNLYFVFNNNYTFNIPFSFLFEDYNDQFKISLIRNNLKYNKLENEENDEDIIIGYSLIKYFNFTIFSYENRSVSFVSDLFIMDDIPKFPNKLIRILLSFLVCILFISIPFLIYIKLKTKYYLSNEFYSNML